MAFYRLFQRLTQFVFVRDVVFHRVVVEPVALVVLADFAIFAPQVAACRELFNRAANRNQRFHFRGNVEVTVFVVTHIQRDDADVVATNQIRVFFAVVESESKHPLQIVEEVRAFFLIQREDNFAVGTGLERVAVAVFRAQRLVVVDFTVDGESVSFSGVIQRLRAGVDVDD